ncbi:MAG: hypothetical protein RBU27_05550 [Bacteroidota bacterium]|jgi:hypothetical protein|nr:hypothetical protein [Bacteroidota bacterium]
MKLDPRYDTAVRIFEQIVNREVPDYALLTELYGPRQAQGLHAVIARFLEAHQWDFGRPRSHQFNASTEISDARCQVDELTSFQVLQQRLLFGELPATEELAPFYGRFANEVREILSLFLRYNLRRKCGITSAAHLNRVGVVVGTMGMDNGGEPVYSTVGFMHDTLEDLLDVVRDEHGQIYGMRNYRRFLERYISPELHSQLRLVTNFYDLILAEVLEQLKSEGQYMNKANLMRVLEEYYSHESVEMHPFLEKMHYVLGDRELEGDVLSQAKWICYSELYIREMAVYTHSRGDYRTFEIKAIDLSDNGHGRDALSMSSRVKNLIKHQIYANYGARLQSTWHGINNRVAELQEDALVHAEHIIVGDLLQLQSYMDFAVSTLLKLLSLKSVFFADR